MLTGTRLSVVRTPLALDSLTPRLSTAQLHQRRSRGTEDGNKPQRCRSCHTVSVHACFVCASSVCINLCVRLCTPDVTVRRRGETLLSHTVRALSLSCCTAPPSVSQLAPGVDMCSSVTYCRSRSHNVSQLPQSRRRKQRGRCDDKLWI